MFPLGTQCEITKPQRLPLGALVNSISWGGRLWVIPAQRSQHVSEEAWEWFQFPDVSVSLAEVRHYGAEVSHLFYTLSKFLMKIHEHSEMALVFTKLSMGGLSYCRALGKLSSKPRCTSSDDCLAKTLSSSYFTLFENWNVSPLNMKLIVCFPGLHSRHHLILNLLALFSTLTHYPPFIPILPDSNSSPGSAWKLSYLSEFSQAPAFVWNFNFLYPAKSYLKASSKSLIL